jgi:hypothetical protein
MTIYYVTNGGWGTGTGSPLSAGQVDGNFYDVDQRIVGLTSDLADGKRIDFVTYTDTDMTFHFTDSSTQTIPLPVIVLKYVGPWMPYTPYFRGDLFTESSTSGFYQVLENHTSAATFNPNVTDGTTANNRLYQLWMPLFDTLDSLNDVTISGVTDGQALVWGGTNGWVNGTPVTAATSISLDGLSDVVIHTGVHANEPLVFDGTNWINSSTIDIPCAGPITATGALNLNRTNGEVQRLNVTGSVTSMTISGWPASGQFARLVLEVVNTGGFTVTWPSGTKWPTGTVPVVTPSGKDLFILVTFDGGVTVYGNVVGQNYS